MTTAVSVMKIASRPRSLLAAPSSCSTYPSAFCNAAASMSALSCARSAWWSAMSVQLDAFFGEVLDRAGVPRNGARVLLLVLQPEILRLLVHGDDVGLVVEHGFHDVVGRLVVHALVRHQDVLHRGLVVVGLHALVRGLGDHVLHVQVAVLPVHRRHELGV